MYALITGNSVTRYPYSFAQLRRDNPQTSYPSAMTDEQLIEHGVHKVVSVAKPVVALTQDAVEGTPVLINGEWAQSWNIVTASAEEIAERQRVATDDAAKSSVKADAFVSTFIAMTPDEVTNYINANVTSLATAKPVINKLALMVLLLARREFR